MSRLAESWLQGWPEQLGVLISCGHTCIGGMEICNRVLVLQGRSHLRKASGRVCFINQGKGTFSGLALFLT